MKTPNARIKPGRKTAVIVFIIIVGSLLLLFLPINSSAQSIQPETTLELHQAEQTAHVAPGEKGVVTFTGTVTCLIGPVKGSVQSVEVSLEANAGGWPWSLTPSTMEFTADHTEEDFSVSVRVPPRTSHVITQQLTVSGRAVMSPGATQYQLEQATAMINVAQFYILEVSCEETTKDLGPGLQTAFEFDVHNEGNDQDHVGIEIESESENDLTETGVIADLSNRDVIIDEGSKETCRLTVTAPKTLNGNDLILIKLRIHSIQSEQTGNGTVEAYLSLHLRLDENFEAPVLVEGPGGDNENSNSSGYIVVYPQTPEDEESTTPGISAGFLIASLFIMVMLGRKGRRVKKRI